MQDSAAVIKRIVNHTEPSPLFSIMAHDEEFNIFLTEDNHLAFGYLVEPFNYVDQSTVDKLMVLLSSDIPADSYVTYSLFASPDIGPQMDGIRKQRNRFIRQNAWSGCGDSAETKELLNTMTEERIGFLQNGVNDVIEPASKTKVRNIYAWIVFKVPFSGELPSEKESRECVERQQVISQILESTGLNPSPMTHTSWLLIMNTLLNWDSSASWRKTKDLYDDEKLLREQVIDYGNDIKVDNDGKGVMLGYKHVKALSIKRYPDFAVLPNAIKFIGDPLSGHRGIKENFLINVILHYPDQEKSFSSFEKKRQAINYQSYGPMLKWVPKLAVQKESFDILYSALEKGDRLVNFSMNIFLFTDSEEESVKSVSNLKTYWREMGYQLLEDRYMVLPLFLNALPMNVDHEAQVLLRRRRLMATRHVVHMLPIVGEWKGTGTPIMSFIGRNGQLMNLDIFDSETSYNTCIAASSGAGKSFLTNSIVTGYGSEGARIFIIDVGRSYEKLCNALGGEFICFSEDSDICMNPFPIIQNYDEEEDMIIGMIKTMASPTEGLSDFQTASLKRVMHDCWQEKGRDLSIDYISNKLLSEDDPRITDIGEQLFAFTSRGSYGKYFNGENNVSFKSQFTVLELEELKAKKHLQVTVLLQLIFQIQQAMYLNKQEKDRKKIVIIDEAWDLLGGSGDISEFIVTGYRRARKIFGAFITVTQSIMDYYSTETGRAIVENSPNMYLLKQKNETIDQLKHTKRLSLGDGGYELLKTVHTLPGKYSEIFFYTDRGAGIGRLIVDRYTQLLYSTKPDEVAQIEYKRSLGMSISDAISEIIKEEKQRRHEEEDDD